MYVNPVSVGDLIIEKRDVTPWESICSWCSDLLDRSLMVDPLSFFSFQPMLHDWCNKGHGMCYPVCGMVHIKEPMLLIKKSGYLGGPLLYV